MTGPTRIDDDDDDLRPDIVTDTPSGPPVWGTFFNTREDAQPIRPAIPRPARWCICGAPWIGGACGRILRGDPAGFPDHVEAGTVYSGQRRRRGRRLQWGPFAVAMICTSAANVVFCWAAWQLLGFGSLAGGILAAVVSLFALIWSILGYASGVVVLLRVDSTRRLR